MDHALLRAVIPAQAGQTERQADRHGVPTLPTQREGKGEGTGRPRGTGRAGATTEVQLRRVMSRREQVTYVLLLAGAAWLTARYALWWFDADHLPGNRPDDGTWVAVVANLGPFVLLTVLEALRILQMAVTWVFALFMRSAVPLQPAGGLRVAVLTAIVPGKEPVAMLEQTLRAMLRIRHPEGFDVWVLDEGDDPEVRALCDRLGVHHFTRHGIPAYNQPDGPFKARTKAGNHNAWADRHGHGYDVVAQMDLDHVPTEAFLEDTLGFFNDEDVAYVIAPQVYERNAQSSWIARGADEQNFGFSALTQRGANRLGMPIFIGSNHLARTAAMESVGGYASHIVEDHLTGMELLTTRNPATGRRWKGVFTEAVISHGEGPSRWSSYLSQQLRWSYGLVDILRRHSPRLLARMRPGQVLGFALIQSYYVSMAAILLIGTSLTTAHLLFGVDAVDVSFAGWLGHWLPQLMASIALWYWLQRFYLRPADRGWGLKGVLVGLGAVVTYLQACVMVALRRPLSYVITPKGEVGTREPLRLFTWELALAGVAAGALGWSLWQGTGAATIRFWAVLTVVQMALVVVTGAVVPGVLRSRPRLPLPRLLDRSVTRVGVPAAVAAAALVVAGQLPAGWPDVAPTGPAGTASSPAAALADGEQQHAPSASRVPAPFLGERSDAVAFGAFEQGGPMGVTGALRHEFVDFGPGSADRLTAAVTTAAADGQVALLTWEPKIAGEPERSRSLLRQVADGHRDRYVGKVAAALAGTGQPVLLRFAPEMDHVTDELHPWSGRAPELYTAAWRRVHRIFADQGAGDVRFAWTPGGYFVGGRFASDAWYPGDRYVDVVGFSAYAFWGWEEQDPARRAGHTFRSPEQLIGPRYRAVARHGKPVVLPEVGIHLHPSRTAEQAAWLRRLVRYVDRGLPELAGLVYFHAPHSFDDLDIDWELTRTEQRAFAAALRGSDRVVLSG
jgi:hypothetical protein